MNLDLTGKNALVCGSTQGIGKAVALELALMGANVTLLARNREQLQKTQSELNTSKSQSHDFVCADFTQPDELKAKIEQLVTKKNVLHILVNNTGGPAGGPAVSAQLKEFTQTFSNHLLCNHILMQATVEGMKKANYGRIINIISTSVKQPIKGLGVSNTIRAAVANWSKTLSVELAPFGITVNNILPGATLTARLQTLLEAKAQKTGYSIEELRSEMLSEIPLGRFAGADEIANAVGFLASPAAAYITGINLPVDGGRTQCL
jgi:3-oxoacyl-[acyl-carrier protein] reductase